MRGTASTAAVIRPSTLGRPARSLDQPLVQSRAAQTKCGGRVPSSSGERPVRQPGGGDRAGPAVERAGEDAEPVGRRPVRPADEAAGERVTGPAGVVLRRGLGGRVVDRVDDLGQGPGCRLGDQRAAEAQAGGPLVVHPDLEGDLERGRFTQRHLDRPAESARR